MCMGMCTKQAYTFNSATTLSTGKVVSNGACNCMLGCGFSTHQHYSSACLKEQALRRLLCLDEKEVRVKV